ncbi:hypothetical protein IAQ67_28410 (plasmid) [Paenibacillus peoriae]|uniref:Uncharacterized protein n=1 Tax=Paenibacillus peoriae TaxID=59893 RepID=A0A7H0YH84_9BACL|nr:hypothetical protein [Paenibacillus peoriae]QNR70442.1 hypothetical protein IAQ67_28410 [Paenibacillus peoriae]
MIIRVTDSLGNVAVVNNDLQENGAVRIQGSPLLVPHLNSLINQHLTPLRGAASAIDEKYLIRTRDGYPDELYKASDLYLQERFIAVDCPLFGYEVEIVKE